MADTGSCAVHAYGALKLKIKFCDYSNMKLVVGL